jgi:HEAT repeats
VPRAPATADALRAILAIREAPNNYDLKRDLGPFLRHKSSHVAAAAATTAERLEASALSQDLTDAFLALMQDPAKRDPGCKALLAIARALVTLDQSTAQIYFAGIRHVQIEPSYLESIDSAAELRAVCAQGLARIRHPDALDECVTLLADKEPAARAGAVRALADSGTREGLLLLRLKALTGDKSNEVMSECFAALLRLAPAPSVVFVAKFLDHANDEIAELAALALAESHRPEAFTTLEKAWESTAETARKRGLLLAIAVLRLDESLEFLLIRVSEDSDHPAADAIAALALYARDDTVSARVDAIISKRASDPLRTAFTRAFERP